ncbi:hypothetical protein AYK24_09970 [Thermoplasmatales archaeon SG8-52-4]|nr:MAG: hypothetical protein AYK24_09970 [Thermoplasmatales archaeon SG8-52-4]
MQERTKAQITVGILAYFASVWILFEQVKSYTVIFSAIGIIVILFIVLLILSYVIIGILDWVHIFDLKTNAVLTLIILTAFMINLNIYLLIT